MNRSVGTAGRVQDDAAFARLTGRRRKHATERIRPEGLKGPEAHGPRQLSSLFAASEGLGEKCLSDDQSVSGSLPKPGLVMRGSKCANQSKGSAASLAMMGRG